MVVGSKKLNEGSVVVCLMTTKEFPNRLTLQLGVEITKVREVDKFAIMAEYNVYTGEDKFADSMWISRAVYDGMSPDYFPVWLSRAITNDLLERAYGSNGGMR